MTILHGGWLNPSQWDEQFVLLSRRYRVLRYDMRGYGRSAVRSLLLGASPLGASPLGGFDSKRSIGCDRATVRESARTPWSLAE